MFSKYPSLLWLIEVFLLVGILFFGIKGFMILALRTATPMMGVSSDSMTHPNDAWKNYYEESGYDSSKFQFQNGLEIGDLVILRGVNSSEDISVGDVIVWQTSESIPIVHRVAKIKHDEEGRPYFKTRSDKYLKLDESKIYLEDIRGKVIFKTPYLGFPSIMFD